LCIFQSGTFQPKRLAWSDRNSQQLADQLNLRLNEINYDEFYNNFNRTTIALKFFTVLKNISNGQSKNNY